MGTTNESTPRITSTMPIMGRVFIVWPPETRLCHWEPESWLNRIASLNHADQNDHDRDHQQNVDVSAQRVGTDHTQQPKHQQDHEDSHNMRGCPPAAFLFQWTR